MHEMEQVSGGFFVPGVVAGCTAGAATQDNGVLGGIMGCAGGAMASLALAMVPFAGPTGVLALVGLSVGAAYTTYRAQEYFKKSASSSGRAGHDPNHRIILLLSIFRIFFLEAESAVGRLRPFSNKSEVICKDNGDLVIHATLADCGGRCRPA